MFECTTTIDEDTTNVVVVSGSPTDQDGNPLCGPDSTAQIAPCDVRDRDHATVVVVTGPAIGPAIGPGEGGTGGTPGGDLGDTGAPRGLYQLLALGLLLLVAGSAMIIADRRRRGVPV